MGDSDLVQMAKDRTPNFDPYRTPGSQPRGVNQTGIFGFLSGIFRPKLNNSELEMLYRRQWEYGDGSDVAYGAPERVAAGVLGWNGQDSVEDFYRRYLGVQDVNPRMMSWALADALEKADKHAGYQMNKRSQAYRYGY